jgi:hypothetical protein
LQLSGRGFPPLWSIEDSGGLSDPPQSLAAGKLPPRAYAQTMSGEPPRIDRRELAYWESRQRSCIDMRAILITLCLLAATASASKLYDWFDHLASGKGLCCSFADGVSVQDVDWDTKDGSYRVRVDGQWIVVPDTAVVTEPNKFGPAVVWPYKDYDGVTQIRCFLPGAQG